MKECAQQVYASPGDRSNWMVISQQNTISAKMHSRPADDFIYLFIFTFCLANRKKWFRVCPCLRARARSHTRKYGSMRAHICVWNAEETEIASGRASERVKASILCVYSHQWTSLRSTACMMVTLSSGPPGAEPKPNQYRAEITERLRVVAIQLHGHTVTSHSIDLGPNSDNSW